MGVQYICLYLGRDFAVCLGALRAARGPGASKCIEKTEVGAAGASKLIKTIQVGAAVLFWEPQGSKRSRTPSETAPWREIAHLRFQEIGESSEVGGFSPPLSV